MNKPVVDIVELIENNPITSLSKTYQNKLLTAIETSFTDIDQQLFIASFYCFLNYSQTTDYIIDLDNIWKWLGFSTKQKAKDLLEKQFIIDKDYILLNQQVKQSSHIKGGHNKETFLLNIRSFKLFCLKLGTNKAQQIHEYYIKLEEILQNIILEECSEIKLQLQESNHKLQTQIITSEKDKYKIREQTLIEQFPNNTQCVYYGTIDNISGKNEKLIKFGNSNNLKNRIMQHKDTYINFQLINAFKVDNKLQIENAIKEHNLFTQRQRTITIKNKKYIELLNADGLIHTILDKIIKDIITSIEYSPENYIKILEQNKILKKQIEQQNEDNYVNQTILLTAENKKLKIENIKLIKKYNSIQTKLSNCEVEVSHSNELITDTEIDNYSQIINSININTIHNKNKNNTYFIDGKNYNKLYGSRQDVWNCLAYQTTGNLIKSDLIINIRGKIISKKKSIQETINNRFEKHGVNLPTKTEQD